mgnify:CR=1 FL=1
MQFKDRTFIVTGGASGLGAATTKALLEEGAKVVVVDLKGEAPEGAVMVETDVTDEAQVAAAGVVPASVLAERHRKMAEPGSGA